MIPIEAGLKLAAEGLAIAGKELELKNAPDVKEAAKRQDALDKVDAAIKAVKECDLDAFRKNTAE